MNGTEILKALDEVLKRAQYHELPLQAFHFHPNTLYEVMKFAPMDSVAVQQATYIFGVRVFAKSSVTPGYVGLDDGTNTGLTLLDLREFLPVRPWWLRLDTVV